MDKLDYYLVASRAACMALAVASFAVGPPLSPDTLVAEAFVAVKASAFLAMFMCPLMMLGHAAVLRQWQWFEAAPGDQFSYPVVFVEWAFAAVYWGSGSAALGVLIEAEFRLTSCVRHQQQSTCLRYDVACGLALLLSVVSLANAVVLHLARINSNGPRLLQVLFGH